MRGTAYLRALNLRSFVCSGVRRGILISTGDVCWKTMRYLPVIECV